LVTGSTQTRDDSIAQVNFSPITTSGPEDPSSRRSSPDPQGSQPNFDFVSNDETTGNDHDENHESSTGVEVPQDSSTLVADNNSTYISATFSDNAPEENTQTPPGVSSDLLSEKVIDAPDTA